MNIAKTYYLIFYRSQLKLNNKVKVFIKSNESQEVPFTKFFAIIIDKNLKWTNHISYTQKKEVARHGYYMQNIIE